MRKPNSPELRILRYFVSKDSGTASEFPGAGEQALEGMVREGWLELVVSPETAEARYRITEAGRRALDA